MAGHRLIELFLDDITRLSCDTIKKLSSKDSPFQIKADAILVSHWGIVCITGILICEWRIL